MKARVKKVNVDLKETVLLYCVEEEKAAKITRILTGYNVKVLAAGVEDSGQSLGTMFGLPEHPRREGAEVVEAANKEMIFFGGFSQNRLDLMLGRIRAAGANITYKAIMTATNQSWPIAILVNQVVREHMTYSKLDQLNSLCMQLIRYNPRVLPDQARNEATESLVRARAILKNPRGVPPEVVEMTIASLQRCVAAAMASVTSARSAAAAAAQSAPAAESAAEVAPEAEVPAETQE